jgi:hypothetical protein
MSGAVRPYNLQDVLRTIYGAATGQTGVSTTAPTSVVSLVGEADEQVTIADTAFGLSAASPGWDLEVWGAMSWS